MSDDDSDNPDTASKTDDSSDVILEQAHSLYSIDKEHWNPIYSDGKDDLDFLSDDPQAQWPDREYKERFDSGRPTLTIDYLTQFVHQVANNIRMNTPSINPLPAGSEASIETAKMLKGLIRKIEYNSSADAVYDNAATGAVKASIGYAMVDHDYVTDDSDEQELKICKIINQFMVYPDSRSIESDGSDQEHCTVLEEMSVADFKKEWPGKEPVSFGNDEGEGKALTADDKVTIAQFFIRDTKKEKERTTGANGNQYQRTKTTRKIRRYKLSGKDVLAKTDFPGEYIPVVPFYGEEAWNNGKRRLHSLIRKSKQSQYMLNLMKSVETEILLKQPIAPVTTPAGAIENYADDWKNPSKAMALRFDTQDADGNPLQFRPERLAPPGVPIGMVQAAKEATDDIKATMGLYNNAIGEQGQEVSGKAINARKIQGDVATFHYGDNAVRSITHIGRILVCSAGEIYDTPRLVQIMDDEDKSQTVGINGEKADGQDETHYLSKGRYDVRVVTGQSFTTRRQESASFYQDVIKTQPQMLMVCGDLMFENMDVEGAQAMASRMKKLIDPKLLQEDGKEQDPQVMALQKQLQQAQQIIQQGAQELQQLQQQLKDKNSGVQGKLQNEADKNQISMLKQQGDAQAKKMEMLIKLMQLAIDDRRNDIVEQNNAGNMAIKAKGQHFDQVNEIIKSLTAALPSQDTELPEQGNTSANDGGVSNGGIPNV